MSERRGVKGLELWCKKVTSGYPGVKVENMTTSWRNGLAFCAIIHRFRPDLIDFFKLNKDDIYENNELAFRIAEHHLGIPALLEPIDMVQYEVPDRLSILTYLSQFYQAFAAREGPNSITGKRLQAPPDHELGSPTSSSPPSKVASFGIGRARRQPCAKCNLHVYIAERLTVGKSLFHRPCFRCARCGAQLAPASYYETENGEYCCEVCPDEEKRGADKPAGLSTVEVGQPDDYSALFEAALESVSSTPLKDETRDFPTDPRSSDNNGSLSFDNNLESIDNVTKEEKQLSVRARMRLFEDSSDVRGVSNNFKNRTRPFGYVKGREGVGTVIDDDNKPEKVTNSENIDRLSEHTEPISSEFSKGIFKSTEITLGNVTNTETEEVSTCADDNVEVIIIDSSVEEKSVDREISLGVNPPDQSLKSDDNVEVIVIDSSSEEKALDQEISLGVDPPDQDLKPDDNIEVIIDSSSEEKALDQEISLGVDPSDQDLKRDDTIEILKCTDNSFNTDILVTDSTPEDNYVGGSVSEESVMIKPEEKDSTDIDIKDVSESTANSTDVIIDSTPEEKSNRSVIKEFPQQSINSQDDVTKEILHSTADSLNVPPGDEIPSIVYPVDLNPFGDDEGAEYKPTPPTRKKQSSTPSPAERKKDPTPSRKKISIPEEYKNATFYDDDLNPFGEDEDEDTSQSLNVAATSVPTPRPRRKISLPPECKKEVSSMPVHRITINPHDGSEVLIKKNMESYDEYLNPFADVNDDDSEESSLRQSDLSANAHLQEMRHPNSSLSIDTSLMFGSTSSISSGSMYGSARKKKPAPRPPVFGARFNGDSVTSSPAQSNVSSPSSVRKRRKDRKAPPPPIMTSTPAVTSHNEERVETSLSENDKGKENEEPIHRNMHSALSRFSHLNKSTHGRWKQKKGQAPALPIPQKRTIKSLPMSDIRRELDLIEIQQQGLERQSVKIEQMIREKEGDESETGEDLPIEVEDLLLQLFEIVNEKNELLRKQTELMYLKKEQRLEEEHAEIEYQIRCLMAKPEDTKTASDKTKEDELIKMLVDVVERRNEIIKCLDMDRVKEAEEDSYISTHVNLYTAKRDQESSPLEEKNQGHKEKVESKDTLRKKLKRKFKHKKKSKTEPEKDTEKIDKTTKK